MNAVNQHIAAGYKSEQGNQDFQMFGLKGLSAFKLFLKVLNLIRSQT